MIKTLLITLLSIQTLAAQQLPEKFLSAMQKTETIGARNNGIGAKGRHGELGPFQITRACFKDSKVPGSFENCKGYEFSVKVANAYLKRYAKDAIQNNDFERLARTWNGGPNYSKWSTEIYWTRFKSYLKN